MTDASTIDVAEKVLIYEDQQQPTIEQKAIQDVSAGEMAEEVARTEILRQQQEQLLQLQPSEVRPQAPDASPPMLVEVETPAKDVVVALPPEKTAQEAVSSEVPEVTNQELQPNLVEVSTGTLSVAESEYDTVHDQASNRDVVAAAEQLQDLEVSEPESIEHDVAVGEKSPDLIQQNQAEILGESNEQMSEAEGVANPAIQVTEHILEHHELAEPQQAQTEALVAVLPESVQESLVEFIEVAEPEQVEEVGALVVDIAEAADRLSALFDVESNKIADTEEVEKIEAIIIEMYEELLQELGVELDEGQKNVILIKIREGDYSFALQGAQNRKLQKKPEIKHAKLSFSGIKAAAHELIGQFAVSRSANLISYQADTV